MKYVFPAADRSPGLSHGEGEDSRSAGSWAQALFDPKAFAHEQDSLSRVWTLVGLTTDIPRDNDWFTAKLGGRSIFIQRFGEAIRAFENRCAHRHYPLRNAPRGNGVVRCGFHHWMYDKEGRAVGIPRCPELFDKTPRELGARLNTVEIGICGALIFGRFAGGAETRSLEDYLGDGFTILKAFSAFDRTPRSFTRKIKANWRLPLHISMDDYHIVAVHPTGFGKNGYLQNGVTYFRFGDHSAFFPGAERDAFDILVRECRDGTYTPHRFRIFHFFPNLSAVIMKVPGYWLTMLFQYRAVAMERTEIQVWYYPAPFQAKSETWVQRTYADQMTKVMPFFIRKVLSEDNVVNERHQSIAGQIDGEPIYGRQEERIIWYEESYRRFLGLDPAPPPAAFGAGTGLSKTAGGADKSRPADTGMDLLDG